MILNNISIADHSNAVNASIIMRRRSTYFGICVLIGILVAGSIQDASGQQPNSESGNEESQSDALGQIHNEHRQAIDRLIKTAETNRNAEFVKYAKRFSIQRDPVRDYIFVISNDHSNKQLKSQRGDSPLGIQLEELNVAHAQRLFEFAANQVKRIAANDATDRRSRSYQLLHEVLYFDPDHAEARRILGYRKNSQKQWFQSTRRISSGLASTKHALTGWRARNYFTINSAHYRISTTADRDTAIELAHKLERWHSAWRQLFFDYWAKQGVIDRWFAGKSADRPSSKKHNVVFFKNRDEYVQTLTRLGVNGVEVSSGYYNDRRKTMFFYATDAGQEDSVAAQNILRTTWLQEQAHQLFQETGQNKKNATEDSDVWAVEAIAMYFETLIDSTPDPAQSSYMVFGGFDAQRLQYARIRANRQGFYLPMKELISLGREKFQTSDDVRSLYSQSAGIAQFMMSANPRYRSAFIRYVQLVYQNKTRPDSLSRFTGQSYEELDAQYKKFLVVDPADVSYLTRPEIRTEFALGAAPLTTADLVKLSACKNMNWIQLSATRIDDASAKTVSGFSHLTKLFVDGTEVGDKFLAAISGLEKLEELDLSRTEISDDGLSYLSKFKNLKALWLTGTNISDRGLQNLEGLKNLEYLEVTGTNVSAEALRNLKSILPKLR